LHPQNIAQNCKSETEGEGEMTAGHLYGNGTIVIEKVDRGVVEYSLSGSPLVGSISGEEKLMQEAKAASVTKLRLSDGSLVTIAIAAGGSGGTRWVEIQGAGAEGK
jgi:hypothetical protein